MRIVLLLLIHLLVHSLTAQTIFSGRVVDSLNQPIPFVKILFLTTSDGDISGFDGSFSAKTLKKVDSIQFSYVGYQPLTLKASNQQNKVIVLKSAIYLETVEVFAPKKNSAFEILKQINFHRHNNDPQRLIAYENDVYNKMQIDLTNLKEDFNNSKLMKNFNFIGDYADTLNGKKYLPVLLSEAYSKYYFKSKPNKIKEIIKATKVTGVDELYLAEYVGDLHQNVNIYDQFINVFGKSFLSPIALTGRAFYKYYLMGVDTIDNHPCYHLKFRPRRKGDAVFIGDLWITKSNYAVVKVIAKIPRHVNLNFVSNFKVEQGYELINDTKWMVTTERVFAEFKLFNEASNDKLVGFNVRKTTIRSNFTLNKLHPNSFYIENIIVENNKNLSNNFWNEKRKTKLTNEELGILTMVDSLKKNKTFKFYNNLAYLNLTGFWKLGYFELGDAYYLYSRNTVEGNRFLLNFRTSDKFSKTHELSTFGAYGFLDKKIKYGLSYRYKFKSKPRGMLRLAYSKKIEQLGLASRADGKGKSFTSLFTYGPIDKITLVDNISISIEKDYKFNLRTFSLVEWKHFTPLGTADYKKIINSNDTISINSLTSFEVRNEIMFTKNERFIQGNFDRYSLGSTFPILSLTHTLGIKNILSSELAFNRFDIYISHSPKLGFWGRLNYKIYAGKIFGTLPYPFLNVHNGNQSFYLETDVFNLLNFYEFVSDKWLGVNFEHKLQGFILDKIPLIKKLEWRSIYGFKGVVGKFNNKHLSAMLLPENAKHLSLSKPYMEMNIGIENIFQFIRIDAIWRLSYLDSPNISKFGVKFLFSVNF